MQANPASEKSSHISNNRPIVETGQYLTFSLGDELFAVGILVIKEIIQFGQLTTVPMMPSYIRGVINLRGAVVPVIDLYARFGLGTSTVGKRTCIVIIEINNEGETHDIGIMVDAVSAVIDIASDQIEPAPTFGSSVRNDFIEGMGKVNDRFVIILDVVCTFSVSELASLENLQSSEHNNATRNFPKNNPNGENRGKKTQLLSDKTIKLAQESWAKTIPIAAQAANLFYSGLFVRDPSLKALFHGDMVIQGEKLMKMIGFAVSKLNDLDSLIPELHGLGRRHATYGVQASHYETVGAAFLDTLKQGLGDDFTEPVRDAWVSVYGVLSKVMTEATFSAS